MKRKDENEMKAPNEAVNDAPYYQFLTRPLIGNLQIAESIRRERHATALPQSKWVRERISTHVTISNHRPASGRERSR